MKYSVHKKISTLSTCHELDLNNPIDASALAPVLKHLKISKDKFNIVIRHDYQNKSIQKVYLVNYDKQFIQIMQANKKASIVRKYPIKQIHSIEHFVQIYHQIESDIQSVYGSLDI